MEKHYEVNMTFTFTGKVEVIASSKEEAREYIDKHFGCTIGQIHTNVGDEEIPDWDFHVHPEKKIKSIKKLQS